jgi:hypothetical protein
MITSLLEKKGGIRRLDGENKAFRDWIENYRLIDIPTINGLFTWNNRRRSEKNCSSPRYISWSSETLFRKTRFNDRCSPLTMDLIIGRSFYLGKEN